jgi:GT2 family glycosyltransferase
MHRISPTPIISVIIPTYNRRDLLKHCLSSIFRQTYKKFEVIVIDDASSDGTTKFIKDLFQKVKTISNTRRLGPPFCRNQGILSSKGGIILFLDSDTEVLDNNVFSKLPRLLWGNKKIGSVGGEIIPGLDYSNIAYGRNIKKNGMSIKIGCLKKEGLKECDYLPTCNCAVRKEVALEVGGFDPYYIYGAEDKEFGFLIKQRGYQNYVSYEVAALHKFGRESRRNIAPYCHWSRTTLRFHIKNRALRKILLLIAADFKFLVYKSFEYGVLRRLLRKKSKIKCGYSYSKLLSIPLWLMSGYVWNIIYLIQTLKAKGKNFLVLEEMLRFKRSKSSKNIMNLL